jgi:hypothetical protein
MSNDYDQDQSGRGFSSSSKPFSSSSQKEPFGAPKAGGGGRELSSSYTSEGHREADEAAFSNLAAINRRLEKVEGMRTMIEALTGCGNSASQIGFDTIL